MAGIGDSWGTREELLHPRGPDGRWIRKGGIAKNIIGRILEALANFRPRMFQSQGQANQYLKNVASRKPARFQGGRGYGRLLSDLGPTNEDLRDGVIDNPSTKKFVDMMDQSATELPDDVILTRHVGVEAFGFTPQTAQGTNSDTDPGIRAMSGKLVADRGYSTTTIGEPRGAPPPGSVRMVIAARKGTKVIVPGSGENDSTVFLDRDQPLRITKIEPDGSGGWVMYALTDEKRGATPEPIGGPVGAGTRDTKQREADVARVERIRATREKRPDEEAEQADFQRRRDAAEAGRGQEAVPSPAQEAERRRVEQLEQQAGVQPRTEPIQTRSIGGEPRPEAGAPGAEAPGAPEAEAVPRRTVDLRLAVRDAGIEAPAAGPNRKRFNDAYEGVISGKKEPIDAVRELRRDARDLRGQEGGREDADILDRLADVIKREYALPDRGKVAKFLPERDVPESRTEAGLPKVRQAQLQEIADREEQARAARAEKRTEAAEKKATAKKAAAAPTPAKKEEAAPAPKLAPAKAAKAAPATPERTPEQEIKGLFNGKRPTNAQLRQMGEDNNLGFGPKEPRSEMIQAILGARPTRGRQRGELTPEEVAQVAKKAPAKKTAPAKKAAPEAPGDDLDRMTKAELLAEAERREVTVPKSWTKDKIKAHLRDEGFRRPEKKTPEQRREQARESQKLLREFEERAAAGEGAPTPAKKAAKAAVPEAEPTALDTKNLKIGQGISATRIKPGDVVWVEPGKSEGVWLRTRKKTGSFPLTVTRNERESGNNYILHGTLPDGREVTTAGYFGQNTFYRVEGLPGGGVPVPAKGTAKAATPTPDIPVARAEGPSGHPGDTGMARALIPEQRDRQVKLDRVKAYGSVGTEIDELLANEASPKALAHRIRTRGKQQLIPDEDIAPLIQAAEAGDNDRVRALARELMDREGIVQIGSTGDVVPLDRNNHQSIDRAGLPRDVSVVHVVRPGSRATVDGEDVLIDRAVVEPASPDEVAAFERSRRRVPEGSVAGDRAQAPVRTEPRKRSLDEAWDAAGLDAEGSPGRSMKEIREDISSGKITPEEGIRRMEDEIAFNKEDLAEVDANLRQPDLTDEERAKLQTNAAVLTNGIEAQEKASKFLRMYFRDEKPTVEEVKLEVTPEQFEVLERATPESLREAAKEMGLRPPKGESKNEIMQDMVIQVAEQVARDQGIIPKKAPAKKAAKAAKKAAPAVPVEREKIDARLIGTGLDFDENDKWTKDVLSEVQTRLDEGQSPASVGRELDERVRSRRTINVYENGSWHAESSVLTPEERAQRKAENQANYDRIQADTDRMEELATRLKATRRKPVKKASPEVQAAEKLADSAEARLINDRLVQMGKARNREQADQALDGLTMQELRRIAESLGEKGRSKRELRDKILDRLKKFDPEPPPPAAAPTPEAPEAPTPRALARGERIGARAKAAGIEPPALPFSGLNDAEGEANRMLQRGESPTAIARMLRERAAIVAKADLNEEGRRFRVEHDKDTLRAARKANAEYLRRLGTMLQQDEKKKRVSTEDRVAARLLERMNPEVRDQILADMPEGDRKAVDEAVERVRERREVEVENRIRAAYRDAATRPGAFVSLGDIRARLGGDLDREEVDRLLLRMGRDPGTMLVPENIQKSLTDADREGGITLFGRTLHHIRIDDPSDRPLPDRDEAKGLQVIQGEGRGKGPSKATRPTLEVVGPGRKMSTKTPLPNTWGGNVSEVHFHEDGAIGMALDRMGENRLLDVDGEPLQDVLGKLATRAVRGQISQQQLIQEIRQLAGRFPQGSAVGRQLDRLADQLDKPPAPSVDLPDDTPGPLVRLMERLRQVPLASKKRDNFTEIDELLDLIRNGDWRLRDNPRRRAMILATELRRRLLNRRHESEEGKFEIDRAIREAMRELEEQMKGATT